MPTYPNDMRKSSFQESPPLGRLTPGVLSPVPQKALFGLPLVGAARRTTSSLSSESLVVTGGAQRRAEPRQFRCLSSQRCSFSTAH